MPSLSSPLPQRNGQDRVPRPLVLAPHLISLDRVILWRSQAVETADRSERDSEYSYPLVRPEPQELAVPLLDGQTRAVAA